MHYPLTVLQEALKGRVIPQPQGKVLGGSSAINAEVFVPPSKSGVNSWAKLGNPGWDWATLAPYFHKFYTLNQPEHDLSEHLDINWITQEGQGTSGPVQASFQGTVQDPLSKAWVQTLKEVGYCITGDPFSGSATGGFSSPMTVGPTSKTRSYAGSAYFLPASGRKNLHVVTRALVHRILLEKNGEDVSATGVQVELQGALQDVKAQKEVIVACGALQTPKVLELSGIGDANLLKSHGITPIIDNPNVGENLQDHLMTGISHEVRDGIMTGDALLRQKPASVQAAMQMYMENKTGPFCSGGIGSYAFMPVTDFVTESGKEELRELFEKYPAENEDMERYNLLRAIFEDPKEATDSAFMFLAQVKLHADDSSDFTQNLDPGNFISLGVSLLHPLSRGSVHIASADATQPPTIDPKYFSNELDVEFMARDLRFMETIAESQPLASFIKPGGKRNHATAHGKDLEAAKDYVRTTAISNNHPACSCPMMPRHKGAMRNFLYMEPRISGL